MHMLSSSPLHLRLPLTFAPSLRRSAAFRPTSAAASTTAEARVSSSLYDVLGLHSAATRQEIKAAYRRLARSCHPDVDPKDGSTEQFIRIRAAYATLSDPDARAEYDRRAAFPLRRTSCRFSTRSTWETDQCW